MMVVVLVGVGFVGLCWILIYDMMLLSISSVVVI